MSVPLNCCMIQLMETGEYDEHVGKKCVTEPDGPAGLWNWGIGVMLKEAFQMREGWTLDSNGQLKSYLGKK